jgi:hypothetical protein
MVGNMLMRGMLIGVVAGILSFGFLENLRGAGGDRAITFETAMDEAKDKAKVDEEAKGMTMPKEGLEPELVSRPVQAGIGLFTGVTVYNTAFGDCSPSCSRWPIAAWAISAREPRRRCSRFRALSPSMWFPT